MNRRHFHHTTRATTLRTGPTRAAVQRRSWNEVRDRADQFAHESRAVGREQAGDRSFCDEYFDVFGRALRAVRELAGFAAPGIRGVPAGSEVRGLVGVFRPGLRFSP